MGRKWMLFIEYTKVRVWIMVFWLIVGTIIVDYFGVAYFVYYLIMTPSKHIMNFFMVDKIYVKNDVKSRDVK